jgi:hypothetical protein
MNWIAEFLIWCVILATCVGIGAFVLQIGLGVLAILLAGICAAIGWVVKALKGEK